MAGPNKKSTQLLIQPLFSSSGLQKMISEHIKHKPLKQMSYKCKGPCRGLCLSTEKQGYQTIIDIVVWSGEVRFLLWHADGWARIWHAEHQFQDEVELEN